MNKGVGDLGDLDRVGCLKLKVGSLWGLVLQEHKPPIKFIKYMKVHETL